MVVHWAQVKEAVAELLCLGNQRYLPSDTFMGYKSE
jgi:hypothetical protein